MRSIRNYSCHASSLYGSRATNEHIFIKDVRLADICTRTLSCARRASARVRRAVAVLVGDTQRPGHPRRRRVVSRPVATSPGPRVAHRRRRTATLIGAAGTSFELVSNFSQIK